MKRRDFLKAATATGASVALAGSGRIYAGSLESQKSQLGKQKPNVILIMTDDQGYGDLACHGNPSVKTPYLDRLYAESTRFTDFHVDPFCAPTRASLMTGRMSDRTHVRSTVYLRNHMNRDETTMAEFFSRYFGAASEPMRKFYLKIETTYHNYDNYEGSSPLEEMHQVEEIAWKYLGTDERMNALGQLIEKAKSIAVTDLEKERVALWEKGVWNYMVEGKKNYLAKQR